MQIPIRWSDNTLELRKHLQEGISTIEATRAAAEKMARSLGGDNLVAAAHKTAAAIELIGGASKLTAAAAERVNSVMTRAVEVLNAAGKGGSDVAKHFQSLADATRAVEKPTIALTEATAKAKTATDGLAGSLGRANSVLAMFGASLSIGALIGFGRNLLNTADHLVKVADSTGLTTTEVQKLEYIAGQSGNSLDELTGAVSRLQRNLVNGDAGAVQAIKSLGLNFQALRNASPYDQMEAIATAIAKVPDPAARAALAVELFGRTGAAILPTLIANFQQLGDAAPVMSDKTVRALERAGDQFATFGQTVKVWAAESYNFAGSLFDRLVAKIYEFLASSKTATADFVDMAKQIPGMGKALGALGIDTAELRKQAQWYTDAAKSQRAAIAAVDVEVRKAAPAVVDLEKAHTGASSAASRHATELSKAKAELDRLNAELERSTDAVKKLEAGWFGLNASMGPVTVNMATIAQEMQKVRARISEIEGDAHVAAFGFKGMADGLTNVGTKSTELDQVNAKLKETAKSSRTLADVFASIPKRLADAFTGGGNFLGAVKAIGTDMGAVMGRMIGQTVAMLGKFGGPIGEAIGSLAAPIIEKVVSILHKSEAEKLMSDVGRDWGTQISAGLAKKLEADSKQFGRQAAGILHLKDIFAEAGGINVGNFDLAAGKLRDLFSMIETGQLSIAQGAKVIDENWQDLAAAGTDAFGFISPKLKEIIALNTRLGTQSKEIAAFLKAQGAAAVSASNAVIASLTPQIAKWTDLKDRIAAAKQAGQNFSGLLLEQQRLAAANSHELENMGLIALSTFAAAVAGGATFAQALAAAGPGLSQLKSGFDALGISTHNAALQALLLQNTILEKNPTLIAGISALGSAFAALSNMGLLNIETFTAMEETGASMYARLQAEAAALGGGTREALLPMQEFLHAAEQAAKALGVPLDENTSELIRQSKELGVWREQGKTAAEKVTDAMTSLVEKVEQLINTLLGIPDVDYTITEHRRVVDEGGGGAAGGGGGEGASVTTGNNNVVGAQRAALALVAKPMPAVSFSAPLPAQLVASRSQWADLANSAAMTNLATSTAQDASLAQAGQSAQAGGMERVDVHLHLDGREVARTTIDAINAGGKNYEQVSKLVNRIVTDRKIA